MAIDLCKDPACEVVSVDVDEEALVRLAREHPIQIRAEDLSTDEGVTRAVEGADLVIGSVPYSIGYAMLEGVIRAGKNVVDISYFPEDPFGLDDLAKEKGVTAVVDCGVAPGMANIILGDHTRKMRVTRYECYVGGIPRARDAPFEYKSPFPVLEVLEEYAGSARMVEDGEVVVRPMLSEAGTIEFEVKGASVRPIHVTAALLSPHWMYEPGEADLTVMRLVISGEEDGKPATYTYDLYDEYDPTTGALSMARTTGYTCTAVARLVLDGGYSREGICPPEFVGRANGCRERVEEYLEDRGVRSRMQRS